MDNDRLAKTSEIEVEKWGFFMGAGMASEDGKYINYEYSSYANPDVIKELWPHFITVVFSPLFQFLDPSGYQDTLDYFNNLKWPTGEPELYVAELGPLTAFASNHIPKKFEGSDTNFTQISDHSKCTIDHCVGEDDDSKC